LVLGIVLGAALHATAPDSEAIHGLSKNLFTPVGQIFLRTIFMIVVPMVFSALVLGVYELGQSHGLGKTASKTLLYTVIASSASVLIGISLVNFFKPGMSFQIDSSVVAEQAGALQKIQTNAAQAKSFSEAIVELIPKNPIDSAARALDGEMIALMVFALIFGVAMSVVFRGRNEDEVV